MIVNGIAINLDEIIFVLSLTEPDYTVGTPKPHFRYIRDIQRRQTLL